ncbi:YciI family protein [Methylovirgula sp. 4M-Z18]|uniref:YciI family protein n=1 Tax=Methylovirgula sp. 4M-Z18 TaxID=2293567 RepID=UPI000E2E8489|nr:YciI family protein [Methylovirgula sp. 4M-Z18]RFB77991.1 hypothetical protein DYH55_18410 [Methylovirgula sp. 4M-Z18]
MLYAVLFTDNLQSASARGRLMPEHLAFLHAHREHIQAAGPLLETSNEQSAGGLWLVEADSADRVLQLVHDDPFWPSGLRESFRILQWRQVFVRDSNGSIA